MVLGVVTDFCVGAKTECMLNSRRLQLTFSDVYQSEVHPHKTLLVSDYFPQVDAYLPIAAFEYLGQLIEEAHQYVRNVFANTPITLQDYGFDNYFYVGDNRDTARDPIQISLESNKITASLLDDFTIRLPYNNLPPDWPAHYLGDLTFQLNHFELEFCRLKRRPLGRVLDPKETLACPCKWEIFKPVYFNPSNHLFNSDFVISVAECSAESIVRVLSGDIVTTGFTPKIQMDAFRTMIPYKTGTFIPPTRPKVRKPLF